MALNQNYSFILIPHTHTISFNFTPNFLGDIPKPPEVDGKDSKAYEIATYCLAAILGYFSKTS